MSYQTGVELAEARAEIIRLREACDRARTQAEHLAARVRETEAKLARVRDLPTIFTDRWVKFDDVLRAIEDADGA